MTTFSSLFSQILKLFPRTAFAQLVTEHKAEYHARGFTCWEQFVAMLFCQFGKAQSLREIHEGLKTMGGKLDHLGISAPPRSTLSYANNHRPWQLFEAVFHWFLREYEGRMRTGHGFRFRNPLLSIDATTIDLCAAVFDWAHFRRTKGAVKLHLMLDHDGLLPVYASISTGKTNDLNAARSMNFPAGAVVVFDRGYNDYDWFRSLGTQGVWFVTRTRSTHRFNLLATQPTRLDQGVVSDQVVELIKAPHYGFEPLRLRRIEFVTDDQRRLVFLTNNFSLAATTIAAIYKQRWQIELLFKALKQHLRIKTFVGTSSNALHIQIWTALTALLILRYLKARASFGWSLSRLIAMLRFCLFLHRDLWTWLNDPFPKTLAPPSMQLSLYNLDS